MIDAVQVTLILFVLFSIKHFIIDFPLQKPYQWMNKGTYGHPGGILHAGLHALGTLLVLLPVTLVFWPSLILSVLDGVIHYHVDWAKMNINKHYAWKPDTHEQFWILLGLDQLLHMLTYIGIIALAVL